MMKKFQAFQGPSDYSFKDPDTGHEFKSFTRADLVKQILTYRTNNELPAIESLDTVIDTYLCNLPINEHKCCDAPLSRGWLSYLKGGLALVRQMMYNSYVDLEEADRRAEVCIRCPKNIFPDKGPFIQWSDNIALHSIGERKSKYHDQLGNCEICSCVLRAKVFYGGRIDLTPTELVQMQALQCWQPAFSE